MGAVGAAGAAAGAAWAAGGGAICLVFIRVRLTWAVALPSERPVSGAAWVFRLRAARLQIGASSRSSALLRPAICDLNDPTGIGASSQVTFSPAKALGNAERRLSGCVRLRSRGR
jgi:hypothetical protein